MSTTEVVSFLLLFHAIAPLAATLRLQVVLVLLFMTFYSSMITNWIYGRLFETNTGDNEKV